jgi:hypothetical protein
VKDLAAFSTDPNALASFLTALDAFSEGLKGEMKRKRGNFCEDISKALDVISNNDTYCVEILETVGVDVSEGAVLTPFSKSWALRKTSLQSLMTQELAKREIGNIKTMISNSFARQIRKLIQSKVEEIFSNCPPSTKILSGLVAYITKRILGNAGKPPSSGVEDDDEDDEALEDDDLLEEEEVTFVEDIDIDDFRLFMVGLIRKCYPSMPIPPNLTLREGKKSELFISSF